MIFIWAVSQALLIANAPEEKFSMAGTRPINCRAKNKIGRVFVLGSIIPIFSDILESFLTKILSKILRRIIFL